MKYVYSGNVPGDEGENTNCFNCGNLLIERCGFKIVSLNLKGNKCSKCGTLLEGILMIHIDAIYSDRVMKKALFPIDFKFPKLWLVVLGILFIPFIIYAGEFYQCFDKDGNETLIDSPVEGQKCKIIGTYEEKTGAKKEIKPVSRR